MREYVQALRYRGEVQAGLHAPVKYTEAEIAASSSLNPQWREPVLTDHGPVSLSQPETGFEPEALSGNGSPPF